MNTLLLSSGGIKGLSFLGIWKYLEQNNYNQIKTFAGVSIGSLFSLLFLIGYSFDEIYNKLVQTNILDLFSFDLTNFFESYGMLNVEPFENFLIHIIEEKNLNKDITFLELFQKTNKELHTYALCVDTHELECFNYQNTPNCSVRIAVLMSMSIPLIFRPIIYKNKYYIDGAMIDGFPIDNYDLKNTIPCTILHDNTPKITNIFQYIFKIVSSVIKSKDFHTTSCIIDLKNVKTLDITITKQDIDKIIQIGYTSIENWIKNDIDLS